MHSRVSPSAGNDPRIIRKRGAKGAAGAMINMPSTGVKPAREKSDNPAALPTAQRTISERTIPERTMPFGSAPEIPSEKKAVGYGLPCSHCHAYYPADMHACPICKSSERVPPNPPMAHSTASTAAFAAGGAKATGSALDEERERMLKELKSQAFASHTQIMPAAAFQCVLKHQHNGANEPAAVCHTCYSDVRRQADLMEAALHIDPKDAAKIVYDAVWADTSNPNASYFNAAKALLSELHQRAGIGLLLDERRGLAH